MSILLIVLPLIGFAAGIALSSRRAALCAVTGACLVELLLAVFLPQEVASISLLGVSLSLDNTDRIFVALASVASFGSIAVNLPYGDFRQSTVPLMILAPVAGALLVKQDSSAALLLQLSLLAIVPAVYDGSREALPSLQRFITVVALGATVLMLASALAGLYLNGRDPYLPKLVLVLIAIGWSLLLGIFPFQFWLTPLCRGQSRFVGIVLLAFVRPVGAVLFLRTVVDRPWLFSDQQSADLFAAAAATAALACALISLAQTHLMTRLVYMATADLGFVFAGVATASPLGIHGALTATAAHAVMILLLTTCLALNSKGRSYPPWLLAPSRSIRTAGLAIGVLTLLGAPPTGGFVGRWMIYQAAYHNNPMLLLLLLATGAIMLLGALQLLRPVSMPLIAGASTDRYAAGSAYALLLVVFLCSVAIVGLGLYPAPLLDAFLTTAQAFPQR